MSWLERFHTPVEHVDYSADFGFARAHWDAFARYAAAEHRFLIFRSGKRSAIPWIERGFPGKPLQFSAKVDPTLGLLKLKRTEWDHAHSLGHFVLRQQMDAPIGYYVAAGAGGRRVPNMVYRVEWFRAILRRAGSAHASEADLEGVVVNGLTEGMRLAEIGGTSTPYLPFTSDYDLAVVIGSGEHFNYQGTLGTMADPAGRIGVARAGGKWDFTNLYVAGVADHFNQAFGSLRIQHGSQVQYFGMGDDDPATQLANKIPEPVLVFAPDQRVYRFVASSGAAGTQQVWDLLHAINPQRMYTV
ncbi:MAG TPA: hypothetical protein VFW98_10675 [Gemmatimonadaceae bacterium]|nr:hypothetical protein [Gemmatimonadaceae bacterium]